MLYQETRIVWFNEQFTDLAELLKLSKTTYLENPDLIVYSYKLDGYEGSGDCVILYGKKLYCYGLGHCSCYGPEDQISTCNPSWICTVDEFFANEDLHTYAIDDQELENYLRGFLNNEYKKLVDRDDYPCEQFYQNYIKYNNQKNNKKYGGIYSCLVEKNKLQHRVEELQHSNYSNSGEEQWIAYANSKEELKKFLKELGV